MVTTAMQQTTCDRILIIEDEPDLRETLKELLELEGFNVSCAANGQEGLEVLKQYDHSCLILVDLMMPVMNGWQFLEQLRKQHRHVLANIPVVVVSAAADVSDVQQQYGVHAMRKPVDIQHLLALAHEHCTCRGQGLH